MSAICTASVSPNNCGHRSVTIAWDGVNYTFHLVDVDEPLTDDERRAYLLLSARYWRSKGVTLAQFLNRCIVGEEATNVKQYDFLGPGNAVAKTNIGTAYVNILPGANGERVLVDLTGSVQMRLVASVSIPAPTVGPLNVRVIRDADSTLLYQSPNITSGAPIERELDTGWIDIPPEFLPGAEEILRVQAKSITAADDPQFRRIALFTR